VPCVASDRIDRAPVAASTASSASPPKFATISRARPASSSTSVGCEKLGPGSVKSERVVRSPLKRFTRRIESGKFVRTKVRSLAGSTATACSSSSVGPLPRSGPDTTSMRPLATSSPTSPSTFCESEIST
jgi:hypothetical protein